MSIPKIAAVRRYLLAGRIVAVIIAGEVAVAGLGGGLFSKCTTVQRRMIARHAQVTQLPAGIELIKEGEPGDARFVILDGSATVHRDGIEVNQVGPGAYFGEVALLDGQLRSATVVAEALMI